MKSFAILMLSILSIFVGYYSMTQAWGLEIKSWPALLMAYGAIVVIQLAIEALKE